MNGLVGGAVLYCLRLALRVKVGQVFVVLLLVRFSNLTSDSESPYFSAPGSHHHNKKQKNRFFSVLMHASNVLPANSIIFLFPKNSRFSILGQEATLVCNVLPDIELDKRVRRYGVCCGFWFGRKPQQTLYVHARLSSSISCGTL